MKNIHIYLDCNTFGLPFNYIVFKNSNFKLIHFQKAVIPWYSYTLNGFNKNNEIKLNSLIYNYNIACLQVITSSRQLRKTLTFYDLSVQVAEFALLSPESCFYDEFDINLEFLVPQTFLKPFWHPMGYS